MPLKGIVLAGGAGTRLHPVTLGISKQLLPVYDKPMIYYPLSTLMLSGIRDILLISTPEDLPLYTRLLGDGGKWGISLRYAEQPKPDGLAQAFIIGRRFIESDRAAARARRQHLLRAEPLRTASSSLPVTRRGDACSPTAVHDPWRYGVVQFDQAGRAIELEENPPSPSLTTP